MTGRDAGAAGRAPDEAAALVEAYGSAEFRAGRGFLVARDDQLLDDARAASDALLALLTRYEAALDEIRAEPDIPDLPREQQLGWLRGRMEAALIARAARAGETGRVGDDRLR